MKIPVLLMTHNLGIGGSERQMVETAKSLDRRRFEPHVGCFHVDGLRAVELREAGVPILHLPVTSFASPSAVRGGWDLLRYICRNNIQLVHSFDVPLNIFSAPFAWLARKPVVLTSQRAHRLLTPGLYHRMLRVTDRLTDGIVVNCDFMRRHLVEDEHVPPSWVHLCYNGVDTQLFSPGDRQENADPAIGVVCALRPEKGILTLMEAFARLAPDHPRTKLVIVGSGPMLAELQALKMPESCLFVPATADVVSWLRKIDIFVLPSKSEALSNSLMEAMACGCCPVASNVGGNPELLGDSERGVLFEPGNPAALAAVLRALIADTERRRRLSKSAREFILSGFTLQDSVRRMEIVYNSMLEKRKTGDPSHQS